MEETFKPPRRWFRFSLRTMLVLVTLVCIFCGYVGWALNWIRQRREFLTISETYVYPPLATDPPQREIYAPWSIRILGENGVYGVVLSGPNAENFLDLGKRLFPEAEFYVIEPDDPRHP